MKDLQKVEYFLVTIYPWALGSGVIGDESRSLIASGSQENNRRFGRL